jgi:hypothetical protein
LSLGQKSNRSRNRKSHNVEVTSLNPRNPTRRVSLNGVGSGLVQRFATRNVLRDLGVIDAIKRHLGNLQISDNLASGNNRKARENSVCAPAQQLKHSARIGRIGRFAQYVPVANDTGIGAENKQRVI